jgi:glycosyltransferase involved in cell wall biosynthesis
MLTTSYPNNSTDPKGIFIKKLVQNLELTDEVSVNVITPSNSFKALSNDAGLIPNLRSSFIAKLEFIPFIINYFTKCIIKSKDCDIIHANWIFSGIPGLIAKKIYKKPLMITSRGGDIHSVNKKSLVGKIWRFVLKRTDIIVCVSNEIKNEINELIEIDVNLILNGIDNNIFKPLNKEKCRKELKLNKDELILIYTGRLIKEKGPLMLLEAFSEIKNKKLRLIYIGEGNLKEELLEKIKNKNIEENVSILGNVDHKLMPKYLSAADIYVFPRYYEAGGNTLLEGASCGLPIIGTNEGFVKDILNYKGIFLIEKNKEDLIKAIKKLSIDKNLRNKLGKEARDKIVSYGISWRNVAEKYLLLYKKLLK